MNSEASRSALFQHAGQYFTPLHSTVTHSCVRGPAPSPSARQAKRAVGHLYGNQDRLHANENVPQQR